MKKIKKLNYLKWDFNNLKITVGFGRKMMIKNVRVKIQRFKVKD